MSQKKEVIFTFKRHLKRKGYKNVQIPEAQAGASASNPALELQPDLTAEIKGVSYFYKYIESREEAPLLVKTIGRFLKQQSKLTNQKLKLLVPIKQSDAVIQSLNANQLEDVGVIKVSPKPASA
ncbi:MAG: hypothetical protein K8F24_11160 [Bacteroidales bacterium]|nr:hypothetical protein [Bacteroidales bacterium]